MISETTYAAFAAQLQEAFTELESHLENPDDSRLSGQGMLELTRDRLATLAAMLFAPGMPPVRRLEQVAAEITPRATDEWDRPRCQQITAYVDTLEPVQCGLTLDHAGECDPYPIVPDDWPAGRRTDDTRDDDGRWLAGQSACPRGCGHVLMAHRTDVGCVSCDCEHGIPGRGAELIDRDKSHVLPADLADDSER